MAKLNSRSSSVHPRSKSQHLLPSVTIDLEYNKSRSWTLEGGGYGRSLKKESWFGVRMFESQLAEGTKVRQRRGSEVMKEQRRRRESQTRQRRVVGPPLRKDSRLQKVPCR